MSATLLNLATKAANATAPLRSRILKAYDATLARNASHDLSKFDAAKVRNFCVRLWCCFFMLPHLTEAKQLEEAVATNKALESKLFKDTVYTYLGGLRQRFAHAEAELEVVMGKYNKGVQNLSMEEGKIAAIVAAEASLFFLAGEVIGRGTLVGY
mmetsp:Transcript_43182/g.111969  ORF Transcript_43182/g.111969 Transcript_43182/m.111969 type:complete len:155 (-) Transcript_43182:1402-1866(-)